MDVAVNLVESYLRFNGYLTLSEFEVQRRTKSGDYETVTDVDVVGMRLPGDLFATDPHPDDDCRMLMIHDPALELEPDTVDVIVGEVKQGDAVFNPGLTRHEVLHTVLHRIEWIYGETLDGVIADLQATGVSKVRARSGGTVRTRLVAFGRSPVVTTNIISLTHMIRTMVGFMDEFDDVLKPAQFKEPAPAFLRMLSKAGFSVTKD